MQNSPINPVTILEQGVKSYDVYLQADGELIDPVVGEATQYGTPYYAFCNAVLALHGRSECRQKHMDRAARGLDASLRHVSDPAGRPTVSGLDRGSGALNRVNHRDFFWPPILKTWQILKLLGSFDGSAFAKRIAAVDILAAFRSRPPGNWAMVWLSGEWMRFQAGLSPFDMEQIDHWLRDFFEHCIRLDEGIYLEPGHPNSYDLFTRVHMADMLQHGYAGALREKMNAIMESGFNRSLSMQLSDGSLASSYRSTGQTWTLGAQCAYFTYAANFFQKTGNKTKTLEAVGAAVRALSSFRRWQRPEGPYSPVENCLPPGWRVGYEGYTFDSTYGNLALGFLADAIHAGIEPVDQPLVHRKPSVRVEADPIWRAIAHQGPYSVHANACPSRDYDGFGVVDITFGPDRNFQLVSSVRGAKGFFNPGLATRPSEDPDQLDVIAQQDLRLIEPIQEDGSAGFSFKSRGKGNNWYYGLRVQIDQDGILLREETPGLCGFKTLLVPYPRDGGWVATTEVRRTADGILFQLAEEVIKLTMEGEILYMLNLPYGFESRRGCCGLLRLDLAGLRESVTWRLQRET